ncbi:ead/Ea22-like family protein [Salmonella enterica]|nr:ead/Ea22-like family protein [Salmonella enterica]EKT1323943.1 ead/Ea22-like family protein [Salmonella enterica]EKT1356797.1 ead/Ea22-like family protein [Salmonella enterica]EKT2632982.1 ead/Ea22-like family protein [Salmonella enterica]EKT3221910.1 ead/Ea22-like family protein [Salmonella enterica]
MSNIDKRALREEFRYMQEHYSDPADRARQVIYIAAEALLDELETKEEQRANWFQMAQKLGEDLDAAEKRNAEQREYYEGVIADGSKRIAELQAKLETADKLQDSAFRDGLKAGFSYGQTDDQSGFAQCMSAYSTRAAIKVKES